MKKTKLLTTLSSLSAVAIMSPFIATACSNNNGGEPTPIGPVSLTIENEDTPLVLGTSTTRKATATYDGNDATIVDITFGGDYATFFNVSWNKDTSTLTYNPIAVGVASITYTVTVKASDGKEYKQDFSRYLIVQSSAETQNAVMLINGLAIPLANEIDVNALCAKQDEDGDWYYDLPTQDGKTTQVYANELSLLLLTNVTAKTNTIDDYFLAFATHLSVVSLSFLKNLNITSINSCFLRGCTSLTSIDLSPLSSVTQVGKYFMLACESLESVDLTKMTGLMNASNPRIGAAFLSLCPNLTEVNIGSLSQTAFAYSNEDATFAVLSSSVGADYAGVNIIGDNATIVKAEIPSYAATDKQFAYPEDPGQKITLNVLRKYQNDIPSRDVTVTIPGLTEGYKFYVGMPRTYKLEAKIGDLPVNVLSVSGATSPTGYISFDFNSTDQTITFTGKQVVSTVNVAFQATISTNLKGNYSANFEVAEQPQPANNNVIKSKDGLYFLSNNLNPNALCTIVPQSGSPYVTVPVVDPSNPSVEPIMTNILAANIQEVIFKDVDASVTKLNDNFLANFTSLNAFDFTGLANIEEIGNNFMSNCDTFTVINLNNQFLNLTKIGDYFCASCDHLYDIKLAGFDNLEEVGDYFMTDCQAVTLVEWPTSLTSVTTIGSHFFDGCKQMTEVWFDKFQLNVGASIGDYFLANCTKLTKVHMGTIPAEVMQGTHSFEATMSKHEVLPTWMNLAIMLDGDHALDICNKFYYVYDQGEINNTYRNIAIYGNIMYVKRVGEQEREYVEILQMDDNISDLSQFCTTQQELHGREMLIQEKDKANKTNIFADDILYLAIVDFSSGNKTINADFLNGCSNMWGVTFKGLEDEDDGINYINANFMKDCAALIDIDLTFATKVRDIGPGFLNGCATLQTVDLRPMTSSGENMRICESFLTDCYNLRTVKFSPNLKTNPFGYWDGEPGSQTWTERTFDDESSFCLLNVANANDTYYPITLEGSQQVKEIIRGDGIGLVDGIFMDHTATGEENYQRWWVAPPKYEIKLHGNDEYKSGTKTWESQSGNESTLDATFTNEGILNPNWEFIYTKVDEYTPITDNKVYLTSPISGSKYKATITKTADLESDKFTLYIIVRNPNTGDVCGLQVITLDNTADA